MIVTEKDWNRMYDLIVDGKQGSSVAKSIKDKNKAIARYVAGLKLLGISPSKNFKDGKYHNEFADFGNKALELGATTDDIENEWLGTPTPEGWIYKIKEELKAISFKGPIPDIFWKQLRHAGIPVTTIKLSSESFDSYDWDKMRIIFYENTFDQCSVDIGYTINKSNVSYIFFDSDNLDIPNIKNYASGFEWFKDTLFEALRPTIMGDNLPYDD